jgi:hypothetical protein
MCQNDIYHKQKSELPVGIRNILPLDKEADEAVKEQHHPTTESGKNFESF